MLGILKRFIEIDIHEDMYYCNKTLLRKFLFDVVPKRPGSCRKSGLYAEMRGAKRKRNIDAKVKSLFFKWQTFLLVHFWCCEKGKGKSTEKMTWIEKNQKAQFFA